jgi:hypothetical protein
LRGANIVFDTYPISTTTRTDENIRMTILSNGNVGIGTKTPTALLDVNGDVVISGDLNVENLIIGSTNVITEINTKQDTIQDGDLQISKILNLQSSLNTLQDNIDLKQNILTSGTNITIDENNIISSTGGGGGITQEQLDTKQNTLTSSSNITTGTINSGSITGRDLGVLDFQTIYGTLVQANTIIYGTSNNIATKITSIESNVNNKQQILASNINITTGTISSGNIVGRTNTSITAPNITASGNLLYGTTNVATKIASIESDLNTKQQILIATSNIITGTIDSGNITGRTNTSIISPTITASGNLLYGTTNVGTKIGQLETALDATAKLTSANVFTTNQEILGNLKATLVQVSTTNPTLNTHLTSKLYVDTQDNLSAKLSSANDFIGNQKITGNLNVGGTFTLNGGDVNTTLSSILARLDALENP